MSRRPGLPRSLAPGDSRHSYAVLRGLTSPGGGTVAAATTSLPERAEAGRNYDYRYVWIRDQCYVGQALAADGPHGLLDDAVRFVTARLLEHGDKLAPAYRTRGDAILPPRHLRLPGYPGGFDVVGNRVADQFQLDALGESLQLLAGAARVDRLDEDGWTAAHTADEELQSTVEELETTNEELQSTNEELETMNEELQSMNDELQSTNEQLSARTTEISALNHFMGSRSWAASRRPSWS